MKDITHARDFKGIWIPKEIWLIDELNALEKILLIEIDSLDNEFGCVASNEYFANFLGVSETRVSQMISNLKKLDYIYEESFDGRKRKLKSSIKIIVKQNKEDYQSELKSDLKKTKVSLEENFKHNNTSNNTLNKEKNIKKENLENEFLEELKSTEIKTLIDSIYSKTQFKATGGIKQGLKHYTEIRKDYTKSQVLVGLHYLNRQLDDKKRFTPVARLDRFFNIKKNQDSASCWLYWYQQAVEYGKRKFKEEEERKQREQEEKRLFDERIEKTKKEAIAVNVEKEEQEIDIKNALQAKKKHDEVKRQLDILLEQKQTKKTAFIQNIISKENLSSVEVVKKYREKIQDIMKETEEERNLRKVLNIP